MLPRLIFAALFALALAQEAERKPEKPVKLTVTYLANEGFHVRLGERDFVIDAFVAEPYSIYASVPEKVYSRLVGGEEPFGAIELALVSHVHGDHFQAKAAEPYLERHDETVLATSPQVLAKLDETLAGKAKAFLPENGEVETLRLEGIRVDFLRLPHSGAANREIQNLAHVVDLGGVRVLHLGDADASAKNLEPYALHERELDVAFVPYWWLHSADDRRLVREAIAAKHVVAVHVPPAEIDDVREHLAEHAPEVILFEKALETRELAPLRSR